VAAVLTVQTLLFVLVLGAFLVHSANLKSMNVTPILVSMAEAVPIL
jgi:hypothetical protein